MSSKLLDLSDKTMKLTGQLEKCQKKSCKLEREAGEVQKKEVAEEIRSLLKKLLSKGKDKITYKQFETEIQKVKIKALQSEVTTKLNKCSLDKCHKSTSDVMRGMLELLEYRCKDEKKGCDSAEKLSEVLKAKVFSIEDMIVFQRLMLDAMKP
jgi:hypothetical protein